MQIQMMLKTDVIAAIDLGGVTERRLTAEVKALRATVRL